MDNYTFFLSQVLNNPVLVKAVEELAADDVLNLVDLKWKERLENNFIYQEFCSSAKDLFSGKSVTNSMYKFQNVKNLPLKVLVAAECLLPKKYNNNDISVYLSTLDCKPLKAIARAMHSDYDADINLSDDFKFKFNMCSLLSCVECKLSSIKFQERGYTVSNVNQPCIQDTRIFDGKEITNLFISHIKTMFRSKFMALLTIKIDSRYNYMADNETQYRISGKILDIIAFQESKLVPSKPIKLGDLLQVDGENNQPMEETVFELPDEILPCKKEECEIIPREEDEMFPRKREEDEMLSRKRELEEDEVLEAIPKNKKKSKVELKVEQCEEFII